MSVLARVGGCKRRGDIGHAVIVHHVSSFASNDVGVVGDGDERDGSSGTSVRVAQLIAQVLELVRREGVFVGDANVVRRLRGPLKTGVGLKVEVERIWMSTGSVDDKAGWKIAGSVLVGKVDSEESHVVLRMISMSCEDGTWMVAPSFGAHDKSDLGLIVGKLGGSLLDLAQLEPTRVSI